jgi:cysteine desulfurase
VLYFDHNATTPLSPAARTAWLRAADELVGNPSSQHRLGRRADHAMEEARAVFADALQCDPADIVWTSGATEASNQVFHHVLGESPAETPVWVSAIEHPCVLEPARILFGERLALIPATPNGAVDADWIADRLKNDRPALVAVMAANNETGVLQPWPQIRDLCREHGAPFFCDAAQWIGKMPTDELGDCDFVSGSAHKFGGPRGVGFLKCPSGSTIKPLIVGGPQEESRRAGTENLPGIAAAAAALRERLKTTTREDVRRRTTERDRLETELLDALPGAEVIAAGAPRLWNTSMLLMPAIGCGIRWVVKLDKLGCAVSTGSACSSGKEVVSHVLAAMGVPNARASHAVRFSSGWDVSQDDRATLVEKARACHDALFAQISS